MFYCKLERKCRNSRVLCIINTVQLGVVVDFEYNVGKLIICLLDSECLGTKTLKFFSIESSIAPLEFFLTELNSYNSIILELNRED